MRGGVYLIVGIVVVILAIAGLGALALNMIIAKTEAATRAERDAYWSVEIANANAETERRLRLAEMAKQAADDTARDMIAATNLKLSELEKANEALPPGSCGGLGRDRVKLLYGPK